MRVVQRTGGGGGDGGDVLKLSPSPGRERHEKASPGTDLNNSLVESVEFGVGLPIMSETVHSDPREALFW